MKHIFNNKKVIITGHTGFKGSWLSLWLLSIGAKIYGISIDVPTKPSHYKILNLKLEKDIRLDIVNSKKLIELVEDIKPDFIFHLAAQPLVGYSFKNPLDTFKVNSIGTANILESLRLLDKKCIAIFITSDKSYDNIEIKRGYHENDRLGGADPYSGSKGAAELFISSYIRSFFPKGGNIKIGIGRAGNVIGGGDWAIGRILPDVIKSISLNKSLNVRSPNSTRPWQHVLEPISGYLSLAIELYKSDQNHGEAFNFGPLSDKDYTVKQVLNELKKNQLNLKWEFIKESGFKESKLLKLNCNKAYEMIDWKSTMDFYQTIKFTSEWYLKYLNNDKKLKEFSLLQINKYINFAKSKKIKWTMI